MTQQWDSYAQNGCLWPIRFFNQASCKVIGNLFPKDRLAKKRAGIHAKMLGILFVHMYPGHQVNYFRNTAVQKCAEK